MTRIWLIAVIVLVFPAERVSGLHHVLLPLHESLVTTLSSSGPLEAWSHLDSLLVPISSTSSTTLSSSVVASTPPGNNGIFGMYMSTLAAHPLPTKMMTGACLAWTGDWIAQSTTAITNNDDDDDDYQHDKRRAISFALFDAAYRASQHVLYPLVVQVCQGQFLAGMLPMTNAAAVEQTLVSQLIIVPLLYYPVFFGVTSFVQGLTWEDLQIPFLSVCGLFWTMILSVMAGSAKDYPTTATSTTEDQSPQQQDEPLQQSLSATSTTTTPAAEPYCVTGMEEECLIPEDGLFPVTTLDDIAHELEDIGQDLTQEWTEMTHGISDELRSAIDQLTHPNNDNDDDDNDHDDKGSGEESSRDIIATLEEDEVSLRK
ncbi:expressed unknown protein [Seminavis robusta]|uniref:Uncharacterized protein n=1 Tax=Seminavis robusta TaxID=568900 RepID=A0A9N8DLM0_9STRA|nr:expressed unknown protein [Seminavis robusta]|eukprot:Sro210_g087650.1 n/a (372) ;mRNA; r:46515-47731